MFADVVVLESSLEGINTFTATKTTHPGMESESLHQKFQLY